MDKERNEMKIFSFMFTLFNIHISRTSQVYRIDFLQISLIYAGDRKSGFFPRSLFGLKKLGVWYYVEIFFMSFCLNPWRKQ